MADANTSVGNSDAPPPGTHAALRIIIVYDHIVSFFAAYIGMVITGFVVGVMIPALTAVVIAATLSSILGTKHRVEERYKFLINLIRYTFIALLGMVLALAAPSLATVVTIACFKLATHASFFFYVLQRSVDDMRRQMDRHAVVMTGQERPTSVAAA